MIGWFPTPKPDELFYSICARFNEQVGYPSPYSANEDLFGRENPHAPFVLPTLLEHLVCSLPRGHHLTANRLMDEHTFLPFYSYFLPLDRVRGMRDEMRFRNGSRINGLAGIHFYSVRIPEFLRFCPACVNEDRSQFGFAYWHRVHQLPGVYVCPNHAAFLEDTEVPTPTRVMWPRYTPAEIAVTDSPSRPVDQSNKSHALQLGIAQDVKWLLENGSVPCDPKALVDRYLRLLSGRGLAAMSGFVRHGKLVSALEDYFTGDLLKLFQSNFDVKTLSNWPTYLLKYTLRGRTLHPLRHLLMIRFLGHSAESFFKLPETSPPFRAGPWPCLNLTCPGYKKLCIIKAEVLYRTVSRRGILLVATFECKGCGFTYRRVGPDHDPNDLFRVSKILKFGPLWEKALRDYWVDATLSLREVTKRVGFRNKESVKREAERLGLPFPRRGPRKESAVTNRKREPRPKKKPSQEEIGKYRREWLNLIKNNPGLSNSALKKKYGYRLDDWLRKYDSEWYVSQRRRYIRYKPIPKVNWRERDTEIAKAVADTAKLYKNLPGKPQRITAALIARNIDGGSKLHGQLHKLPQTQETLKKAIEPRLAFAERRLGWTVKMCRKENISLSLS
jgi:hypothetical protein